MKKYYEVVLTNVKRNVITSYLADSFSVNDDRILTINSKEFGNVVIEIISDEKLTVNEIELKDKYDDFIQHFERRFYEKI